MKNYTNASVGVVFHKELLIRFCDQLLDTTTIAPFVGIPTKTKLKLDSMIGGVDNDGTGQKITVSIHTLENVIR